MAIIWSVSKDVVHRRHKMALFTRKTTPDHTLWINAAYVEVELVKNTWLTLTLDDSNDSQIALKTKA